jgi:hypothetical protein
LLRSAARPTHAPMPVFTAPPRCRCSSLLTAQAGRPGSGSEALSHAAAIVCAPSLSVLGGRHGLWRWARCSSYSNKLGSVTARGVPVRACGSRARGCRTAVCPRAFVPWSDRSLVARVRRRICSGGANGWSPAILGTDCNSTGSYHGKTPSVALFFVVKSCAQPQPR